MKHPKFVQLIVSNRRLVALDENGGVWVWDNTQKSKSKTWRKLPDTRVYGEEQPAPAPNRYEDGRLWLGGDEVTWNKCGKIGYEWREDFFEESELAKIMTLKEFGAFDFDNAVKWLAKVWGNQ